VTNMGGDAQLESKREKAELYAREPDRFTLVTVQVEMKSKHGVRRISYSDGIWRCSCEFYHDQRTCSHVMAVERLLQELSFADPPGSSKSV
jgi:hypothetical protein